MTDYEDAIKGLENMWSTTTTPVIPPKVQVAMWVLEADRPFLCDEETDAAAKIIREYLAEEAND